MVRNTRGFRINESHSRRSMAKRWENEFNDGKVNLAEDMGFARCLPPIRLHRESDSGHILGPIEIPGSQYK
jgi:hypothetical protein